ncbi:MAG TPA: NADH-quinone oxidoreductase subunit M [Nitrospirales bacterium]|nr:NADH-quinone oxidoreductase subunit M [Nitrospirales bacterium]
MEYTGHLLSWIIFLPLAGAVLVTLIRDEKWIRLVALGVTVADFAVSLPLWTQFDTTTHAMQFVERVPWIKTFNVHYAVGVDGISVLLILLTTLVTPMGILCSWQVIRSRVKEYMILILVLETGMIGVFCSIDFFLFFVFWEAVLIPMYLIIGVWGGPRRIYAAFKFFLYTFAGSLLLLVAILVLYFLGGETFDIQALMESTYSPTVQIWIFWAFFLAFAIKVPMFPFHTWLPDAHVEAPTAGSLFLASISLKMGAYGFLRFCLPMVPDATIMFAPMLIGLSLVAILYGSYMALAQTDMKKLIAYSSVGHMGFITLGIFVFNAHGIQGAILQMINHGITTGALFLCVGMIYDRTHSRLISVNSGVGQQMPIYVTLLAIFSFSSFGIPGTNGFIGEFLILVGAFEYNMAVAAIALPGVILAAAYMLWMLQRIVWGEHTRDNETPLEDLNLRELSTLIPLVVLVFWIGFYPKPFLGFMEVSVEHLLTQVHTTQPLTLSQVFGGS